MALSGGVRLGPYEILSSLGVGGMGEVYRARDTRLAREVAIKVLPSNLAAHRERLKRFEKEARSASSLNHPNIVTVYDIGSADSLSYIAMELVQGVNLRKILSQGPIPLRKGINIAVQLADGLAKAHASGIVHRDLKPENVMISSDGFVKILDFGLAKLLTPVSDDSQSKNETGAGMVLGTIGYMSPEQASGNLVDARSDQFAFGSILYEMTTGKRAFQRNSAVETLSAIITDEPEPVSAINPETPAAIRWIIERCLAKDPEDRYASTRDLARDLQSIRDHFSELVSSSSTPAVTAAPKGKKLPLLFIMLLTGLIAGGLVTGIYFQQRSQPEPPVLHYLTYSGHDRAPAASPDGKTIAFASDRDGSWRIWLKQLSGRGEVALTTGPDNYPRFSPDGSMILFVRKEGPSLSSLYRISVLGGEPRKLIHDVNSGDWSPDNRKVAFIRIKNKEGDLSSVIGVANSDGTGAKEITDFKALQLQHPRWSPDGRMIVIRSIPFGQVTTPLFLVSADGKEKREISPPRRMGWFSAAAWSGPETLVFNEPISIVGARSSTAGRLIEQNINSGKIRTLFWSLTLGNTLDILSPGRLVMDAISTRENLHEVVISSYSLQHHRWLTRGVSNDRQPAYSPDGEWVLFSSNRSGNLDLWMVSTVSGETRRITDDEAEDWDPAFTRDGKNILWSSSRGGHFEVWIANADGSNARQVTNDGADAENPTATPDGKWIVYASYNASKLGLWKIHPDGSNATQIISGDSDLPEVSPDGQYVLYRDERAEPNAYVRVLRLEDHSVLPFKIQVRYTSRHEDLTVGSGGRSRWMPDGKSIAFLDMNEKGIQGIFVQSFNPAINADTRLPLGGFDTDSPTESFGISPDQTRITIAGLESYSSLMVADEVPGVSPPPRK